MTAKWIQVYLRHEDGGWKITKEATPFVESDEAKVLATEDELALTPMDSDGYLTGGKSNYYDLEAYKNVSKEEFFEILESSHLFMQVHIEDGEIKPVKLINKVILKWKK